MEGPAGSSATVSFTVRNEGGTDAPATQTNVRLSTSDTDVTTDDPLLATITTPAVAANAQVGETVEVTIPPDLAAGPYYVWVILDVNNTAGQSNEENDRANTPFDVTGSTDDIAIRFRNIPFDRTLGSGVLGGSGSLLRVCADGSASTQILLSGPDITSASTDELVVGLVGSGEPELYLGTLSTPEWDAAEEAATVIYTHPRLVNSSGESYVVGLTASLDGTPLGDYSIDVYRAPVVMVHGLWGDRSAFAVMHDELSDSDQWPEELLYRIDYSTTNADPFADNVIRFRQMLRSHLTDVVRSGFSVGESDVIGHSMGGILSRLHLQNVRYNDPGDDRMRQAQINRLITLDTPHSGSQAANLLMNSLALRALMNTIGMPAGEGAVRDLQVDSDAILDSLNGGGNLNRNVVPSHVVAGTWSLDQLPLSEGWAPVLIAWGFPLFSYTSASSFLEVLYNGEANDLIVPLSSQLGGFKDGAPYTRVEPSEHHLSVHKDGEVIAHISSLLDTDPASSAFAQGGFNPDPLTYTLPLVPDIPPARGSSLEVTITSPSEGAVFDSGETISVSVTSTGGVDRLLFGAGSSSAPLYGAVEEAASAMFEYPIPEEAVGSVAIAVLGTNDEEFALDSIRVFVEPTATLDSLSAYPEEIYVAAGDSALVSLTGYYADGIERNVTSLPGTTYIIANENVAVATSRGEVVGVSEGETTIEVSYEGQMAEANVVVLPSPPPVANEPGSGDEAEQRLGLGTPYPNPASRTVTVPFALREPQRVRLRVIDLLGREVAALVNGETPAGGHAIRLNTDRLPSGLYLLVFETDGAVETRKLTVLR